MDQLEQSQNDYVFDSRPAWLLQDIQEMRNIRDVRFAKTLRNLRNDRVEHFNHLGHMKHMAFQRKIKNDLSQMYRNYQVEKEVSSIAICFDIQDTVSRSLRKNRERLSQLAKTITFENKNNQKIETDESPNHAFSTNSSRSPVKAFAHPTEPSKSFPTPPKQLAKSAKNKNNFRTLRFHHKATVNSPPKEYKEFLSNPHITDDASNLLLSNHYSPNTSRNTIHSETLVLLSRAIYLSIFTQKLIRKFGPQLILHRFEGKIDKIILIQKIFRKWKIKITPTPLVFHCSLAFRIHIRVYRKKIAIHRIKQFLVEMSSDHGTRLIKRYLSNMKYCQRIVRNFLAVNHARIEAIKLLWERVEFTIRHAEDEREALLHSRARRKRMAVVPAGPLSHIQNKWNFINSKVAYLIRDMDRVQAAYARAARVRRTTAQKDMNALHRCSEFRVDAAIREEIIRKTLRAKRKMHQNNVKNRWKAKTKTVSKGVDEKSARLMLLGYDQKSPNTVESEWAGFGVMLLDASRRERDCSYTSLNSGVAKTLAFTPFLSLTDPSLGKPWRAIIEDAVLRDIALRKRSLADPSLKLKDTVAATEEEVRATLLKAHITAIKNFDAKSNRSESSNLGSRTTSPYEESDAGTSRNPSRAGDRDYQQNNEASRAVSQTDFNDEGDGEEIMPAAEVEVDY